MLEASYGVVICVVAFPACAVVVLSLLFFYQLSAVLCLVALSHKILLPSLFLLSRDRVSNVIRKD